MYRKYLKRIIDILIALILLIILMPLIIVVISLLIYYNNGDVFFIQSRPGKRNKIFKIIKFKTMNNDKDRNGNLLPDDQRLTTVGRLIRKLSIDEIPQLINVITGDMSFIGPRPLLVEYLDRYTDFQNRRHEIRPGITGWAQVNGRNAISWDEKFILDVWYVDNISFILDIKILFMTILKVIKREGISGSGVETMSEFKGEIK